MCGFVGVLGDYEKKFSQQVENALNTIQHRGPDFQKTYYSKDSSIALGHCRLKIVELSNEANQPFIEGEQCLIYNGEIYNHEILRENLPAYSYQTSSDTETLFSLFREDSSLKFFEDLQGMFSGCYIDFQKEEFILFRDSLGIKPLYYSELGSNIYAFSSEIRALTMLDPFLRIADKNTLSYYAMHENWPQNGTFWHSIKTFKPGEIIKSSFRKKTLSPIWEHKISYKVKKIFSCHSYSEAIKFTQDSIEKSVKLHLMSDVPITSYLSGGLDSSIVTTIASQNHDLKRAYTGYFDMHRHWYSELPLAEKLASQSNIDLVPVKIEHEDFITYFDKVILALEEPRMGMGAFSQYMVAKKASENYRVILSGHGGDELFAGYPIFKALLLANSFPSMKSISIIKNLNFNEWPWIFYVLGNYLLKKKYFFAPKIFKELSHRLNPKMTDKYFLGKQDPLNELTQYYMEIYLPGLLTVEDKISMAHSLETRMPLWSQEIFSQVCQIPIRYKLSQNRLKGLYKDALAKWLPKEILNAPKKGFPTPLRHWFREELFEYVFDKLVNRNSEIHDFISINEIKSLVVGHRRCPMPYAYDEKRAHKIWILLCLESWMRQFNINELK